MNHKLLYRIYGAGTFQEAYEAGTKSIVEKREAIGSIVITCAILLIIGGGYVTAGRTPPGLLPATAHTIRVPDANVPGRVAALSGVWEGLRSDAIPARLVVAELHEDWAGIVYLWGDQSAGPTEGGWVRARANVQSNGTLRWRYPDDYSFQLTADGRALVGERKHHGQVETAYLQRVPVDGLRHALRTAGTE